MLKTTKSIFVSNANSTSLNCRRAITLLHVFIGFACSFAAAAASPFSPNGREVTVTPNAALPGVPRTIVIKGAPSACATAELFSAPDARPAIYLSFAPRTQAGCDGSRADIPFTPQVSGALPISLVKGSSDYATAVMIVSSDTNRGTNPVITVIPELGFQNEPRRIIVESEFPGGCALSSPVVDAASAKQTGVLIVRVAAAPCGPAPTPNRIEVSYTPTTSGVERIVVVQSDGTETRILAESRMRTGFRPRDTTIPGPGIPVPVNYPSDKALSDITGAWFDPSTSGSGLLFTHNFNGSDTMFGTWYMYDTNGNARWFTIQDMEWTGGGSEFVGKLYETRAASGGACTLQTCVGNSSRAVASNALTEVGSVRFTFTDIGAPNMPVLQKAKISAYRGNDLILSSALTRLNF
jgi:hypothetical protein